MTRKKQQSWNPARNLGSFKVAAPLLLDLLYFMVGLTIAGFAILVAEPSEAFAPRSSFDPLEYIPTGAWFRVAQRATDIFRFAFIPLVIIASVGIFGSLWRSNVRRFQPTNLPRSEKIFSDLARQASKRMEVKAEPTILWTTSPEASLPWVFWRGNHFLIIPARFAKRFENNKLERKAVIYHEIAHIRSGDTWKTLIVQCLSWAFLGIGALFIGFQILTAIPEWHWIGSTMGFFARRFIPILLAAGVLVYLNYSILRERELWADLIATKVLGNNVSLRNALAHSETLAPREHQVSPVPMVKAVSRRLSKLLRYHPSARLRNLHLFSETHSRTPRLGLALIGGVITVLMVETVVRAIGIEAFGQGLGPLAAWMLEYFVGLLGIAIMLTPIFLWGIRRGSYLRLGNQINACIICCLAWGIGASIGGFASAPVYESLFFKLQSPWSILIGNFIYSSWGIAFALLLLIILLRKFSGLLPAGSVDYPSIRWLVPLLILVSGPPLIWMVISAVWFEVIDSIGWRAYELQLALGLSVAYVGLMLILAHAISFQKVRSSNLPSDAILPNSSKSPYETQLSQLGHPGLLFSRWPMIVLIPMWLIAFFGLRDLHKDYVGPIWSTLNRADAPPTEIAPDGYVRFNDSLIQASVAYPISWFAYRIDAGPAMTMVEFTNPQGSQSLTVQRHFTATTAEELLALGSIALFDDQSSSYLIERAEPISIDTVAGAAEGFLVTHSGGDGRAYQDALLSLDWNYDSVDYVLISSCHPDDRVECKTHFDVFLESFDYVSPSLGIVAPSELERHYYDPSARFGFHYPLDWRIFDLSSTDRVQPHPVPMIGLPSDDPDWWSQIIIEQDVLPGNTSMIVVRYSRFGASVNSQDRFNSWQANNEGNSAFMRYESYDNQPVHISGLSGRMGDITVEYRSGAIHEGELAVVSRENEVWELISLCDPRALNECQEAFKQVVGAIRFDSNPGSESAE